MAVEPNAKIAVHVEQARSLAISLMVVLGELASVVSSSPDGFSCPKTVGVPNSYCSFFMVLLELAHSMAASLCDLVARKMVLNRLKYPVKNCKVSFVLPYSLLYFHTVSNTNSQLLLLQGSSVKYTNYTPLTGISKEAGQSTLSISSTYGSVNENIASEGSCSPEFVDALGIILQDIVQFGVEREWTRDYTRRNLILCVAGEVGELSEKLQFITDDQSELGASLVDSIGQEIGDITIYFARLVAATGFTLMDVAKSISKPKA
jgi:NTP pyrophosphatase (non-canonical NTP hydrolase)